VAVFLALIAAVGYAGADFLGGTATRHASALTIVLWSQLAGSVVLCAVVALVEHDLPTAATIGWGASAGICGGTAIVVLYHALSVGKMSVVSPLTSVIAATLPVAFAVSTGSRPSAIALVGIIIAVVAIAALGLTAGDEPEFAPLASTVLWSVIAGAGFGLFFILLDQVPDDAGLWSLAGARLGSLAWVGAIALVAHRPVRLPRIALPAMLGAGIGDMGANVAYVFALHHGQLALVAVAASLYPAGTVLLARWLLHERIGRAHALGLGLAGAAVVLIALG
jgi:drug/metabolite transporter (DMT)-like permease